MVRQRPRSSASNPTRDLAGPLRWPQAIDGPPVDLTTVYDDGASHPFPVLKVSFGPRSARRRTPPPARARLCHSLPRATTTFPSHPNDLAQRQLHPLPCNASPVTSSPVQPRPMRRSSFTHLGCIRLYGPRADTA